MLAANSSYGRRNRFAGTSTSITSIASPGTYLARPRLTLRNYQKTKLPGNYVEPADFARMKRLKTKKVNGIQKMDLNKKKSIDYTEMAYKEAVSKLKYLLAESYVPRSGKLQGLRNIYQAGSTRINESGEDTDDRSMVSDSSRTKDLPNVFGNTYFPTAKSMQPSKAYSNLVLSTADLQSVPPELTSFIERQEEYIEQLERESQFCRDELTNLLCKVREVVAENDALHNRNKSGFLKCALEEHKHFAADDCGKQNSTETDVIDRKKHRLEGPSIVFESRISELEAQLTQAKLELRKAREENQAIGLKQLSESSSNNSPEAKAKLDQAMHANYEMEMKLEDLQKSLAIARTRESESTQKAKQSTDAMQQIEFEKSQCEAEIRRLKDELDRQHDRLREATQEANRRIADERQQAERRYNQQVEQLSADIASHWDAANKSQLESEKQRRELIELRRELSQKQTFIDNLKKDLQSKISNLQSELNQAMTEKDAAEQEILATKLSTERSERQSRQEQSRLQAEINSYKQRLERADADLVHCRRENLRLSEQIASLEKEVNMNKAIHFEDSRVQVPSKRDNEKELTSMIMDMETKHAATVAGLEDALNNQATLVSQLTAECQSLTQRLDANNLKHKEEMSSLQSNIEYLSNKIQSTFDNQKGSTQPKSKDQVPVVNNSNETKMHDTEFPSGQKNATVPQVIQQEYNGTGNDKDAIDKGETNKYSNMLEEEYSVKDKLENSEYQNEEKYATDDQNYPMDQQRYNEYEQYNTLQYEEQEYQNTNNFSLKETPEGQYSTAEAHQTNSNPVKSDPESMYQD